MTAITVEESRALLDTRGSRYIMGSQLMAHLRAALDREAALITERDQAMRACSAISDAAEQIGQRLTTAEAERDAALARHEGLSVAHQKVIATANEHFHRANKLQAERDAARAEADRLREALANALASGLPDIVAEAARAAWDASR